MTSDLVKDLEELRYKYLGTYHDNSDEISVREMQKDLVTLIYTLQVLLDPFKDYKMSFE